ncbi:hypothetical protein NE237_019834 [Protea cynaroides]|uniref:Uncharacterized protein n=1 Tax=Protea cynaroides TaxID=273540 RepID=A0A9Q0H647_9MAGN|nr:hypothetical protein NE237_019834 [Protea cynaroides]
MFGPLLDGQVISIHLHRQTHSKKTRSWRVDGLVGSSFRFSRSYKAKQLTVHEAGELKLLHRQSSTRIFRVPPSGSAVSCEFAESNPLAHVLSSLFISLIFMETCILDHSQQQPC